MVQRSVATGGNGTVPSSVSTTTVSVPRPSIWGTVREALRGSHQDYTEAPIGRAVVLLAVPMVLEMLMESVFAVADKVVEATHQPVLLYRPRLVRLPNGPLATAFGLEAD